MGIGLRCPQKATVNTMAAYRKFNGITYINIAQGTDKKTATRIAVGVRAQGDLARVVKTGKGRYTVYCKDKRYLKRR